LYSTFINSKLFLYLFYVKLYARYFNYGANYNIVMFGDCYFKHKNKCGAFKADNNHRVKSIYMNEFLNIRDYSSIYTFTAWN